MYLCFPAHSQIHPPIPTAGPLCTHSAHHKIHPESGVDCHTWLPVGGEATWKFWGKVRIENCVSLLIYMKRYFYTCQLILLFVFALSRHTDKNGVKLVCIM